MMHSFHVSLLVMSDTEPLPPTGLEAVKAALMERPPRQRSMSWLLREIGLSRGAARSWDKIPEEYLRRIIEITGVPARVLRPDLAELFSEA